MARREGKEDPPGMSNGRLRQTGETVLDQVQLTQAMGGFMIRHNLQFVAGSFALLLGIVATARGGVVSLDVTVFDTSSKVAFKGTTTGDGIFATPKLQPGNYVVQFNARSAATESNQYLVVVSAGNRKVVATDVAGKTFRGGGAAMRVSVARELRITGQVADARGMAGVPYRIVDGHRFVWINTELGTHRGGHWEDASLAPANNLIRLDLDVVKQIQDRAGEGSMLSYAASRELHSGY
jgi:hypothetical protein